MKAIITSLLIIFSISAFAQNEADSSLTVVLPKRAVWAFAYYVSESPQWSNRKLPDQLAAIVGSDIRPDSLITVTVRAGLFSTYLNRLQSERNEAVRDFYRSVLFNTPAIANYEALQSQIIRIANGNTSQKEAAIYVRDAFNQYQQALQALWEDQLRRGIDWIKN